MLQREGAEIKVPEMFYMVVVQEVLLFKSKSWSLLAAMVKMVERGAYWFLAPNNMESSTVGHGRDVGDTSGRGSA